MSQFHFIRPEWLLALVPLAALLWFLYHRKRSAGNWKHACDPVLLHFLQRNDPGPVSRRPVLWIGMGGLLSILALAGPAWMQLERPMYKQESALVILLDLSRSMDATDVIPSRLTRARYKLLDILNKRQEGQTALIVYAAQPFVVTPLTDDTATIASQTASLTTDIVPNQGSRPDLAFQKGLELLSQAGKTRGDLLYITDDWGNRPVGQWAEDLPEGVRLNILSVGTTQGAPIPLPDGGFLTGPAGEIVIPQLDEKALMKIASVGGGRYRRITVDDQDINYLLGPSNNPSMNETESRSDQQSPQWREEGPWLLLLLLPLAAFAFRRGYLAIALVLLAPTPDSAYALEWKTLWSRPDQQAAEALSANRPEEAAALFTDPEWKAASHYRAGEFDHSLELLQPLNNARAHYNRGNALARLGRLEEAVQAYDTALDLTPEDEDTHHNRKLVKDLLEKQQQDAQNPQDRKGDSQEEQKQQSDSQSEDANGEENSPSHNRENPEDQNQSSAPPDEAHSPSADQSPPDSNQPDAAEAPLQQSPEQDTDNNREGTEALAENDTVPEHSGEETERPSDQDQATEQWLRRVPDDPGGLLKRKFQYQYRQWYRGGNEDRTW
ncbi:MAG: VWA domain-containing protein [Gammaproteobacteria bacterium]|nr:VWA domain-containing protein [Gammaproteobacteria bacterium]